MPASSIESDLLKIFDARPLHDRSNVKGLKIPKVCAITMFRRTKIEVSIESILIKRVDTFDTSSRCLPTDRIAIAKYGRKSEGKSNGVLTLRRNYTYIHTYSAI